MDFLCETFAFPRAGSGLFLVLAMELASHTKILKPGQKGLVCQNYVTTLVKTVRDQTILGRLNRGYKQVGGDALRTKFLVYICRALFSVGFFSLILSTAYAACPSGGIYTAAEAKSGLEAYNTNCASCHNADLSGNAGPALTGPKFVSYLAFTKITPAQLQSFITSQMPANAPGSLTAAQYNDIFAYILSYNHYPAGSEPLSAASLSCLSLLPYPTGK